jgi:hypothetical protein
MTLDEQQLLEAFRRMDDLQRARVVLAATEAGAPPANADRAKETPGDGAAQTQQKTSDATPSEWDRVEKRVNALCADFRDSSFVRELREPFPTQLALLGAATLRRDRALVLLITDVEARIDDLAVRFATIRRLIQGAPSLSDAVEALSLMHSGLDAAGRYAELYVHLEVRERRTKVLTQAAAALQAPQQRANESVHDYLTRVRSDYRAIERLRHVVRGTDASTDVALSLPAGPTLYRGLQPHAQRAVDAQGAQALSAVMAMRRNQDTHTCWRRR